MAPETPVAGLGEVALRVDDLQTMTAFYEDVVGLDVLGAFQTSTFFDIAPGVGGHTQILALFDRDDRDEHGPEAARSTLDHLAFGVHLDDLAGAQAHLEEHGVDVRPTVHAWVQWRSVHFHDPEGNEVEFVAFDESIDPE